MSSPLLPRSPAPLRVFAPAAAALLALWLYRHALDFAYFNDDPTGHFAWMEGQAVADFFTSSAAYGYYRPVVFAALRLFETLFGSAVWPHNPFADHALLLLLHAANTALLWALARRLGGRDGFAWVAALVFAALPFSYEAVGYVASLTHPLLVFWVLAALLLYEKRLGRRAGGRTHGQSQTYQRPTTNDHPPLTTDLLNTDPLTPAYCLLLTTLALLTHENGVFVLPALAGVDWLRQPGDSVRARLRRLWPQAVPVALYLLLWLAIPKNSQQGLNAPDDVLSNAVPFLQTLVFPLLPLLRLEAGDTGVLLALAGVVVALFGVLAWRAGAARLWAFALGWLALSALPSLLFLGPAYVYGSPRLSYLPGVGVAMLWGLPLLWFRNRIWRSGLRSKKLGFYEYALLTALYILALVLPARPFVACQLAFYAETSRLARAIGEVGQAAPADRAILFVNAPFFFSSFTARPDGCPNPYPWTPTGGILIPPYAAAGDFVRFNGGPERAVLGVSYAGYVPGWRTFGPEIAPAALRQAVDRDAVYVFDLGRGEFFDLPAAWQPGGAAASALAEFDGTLALTGAAVTATGDWLDVALDWRVLAPPAALPAVFVHVAGAAGAPVAQSDGPPAGGFAPLDLWRPGDGLSDGRRVDLSALPPGRYTVLVGVYDPMTGARFAAQRAGERLPDDALAIETIVR